MKQAVQAVVICLNLAGATQAFADPGADPKAAPDIPPNLVGVVSQEGPRYSGAKDRYWQVLPLLQARSSNGIFFIDTTNGLGYDLQAANGIYLEHVLGYSFGRSDKNNNWRDGDNHLKGMGNIKGAANTSLAIGWEIKTWLVPDLIPEVRATVPISANQGTQFQASITVVPIKNNIDTLALVGAIYAANSRYLNTYYGVNSVQSQHSGYPAYHPKAGFQQASLNANWTHQLTAHWGMVVGFTYYGLGDKAAASPIVARRDEMSENAGITYTF